MTAKRSKLEIYVHTLQALSNSGPTNLTRLTTKAKVNSNPLKLILRDLIQKELIVGRKQRTMTVYSATPKAKTVLIHFKELTEVLPLT